MSSTDSNNKNEETTPVLSRMVLEGDFYVYKSSMFALNLYDSMTSLIGSEKIPKAKDFYKDVLKIVLTSLNALSQLSFKLSREEVRVKAQQFSKMLDREPVKVVYDGQERVFKIDDEMDAIGGVCFIEKILVSRILKKVENTFFNTCPHSILSLAIFGVEICKQHSRLAYVFRSHFFELCPFLLPFNVPWKSTDSIQTYASQFGHKLKGKESVMLHTFLERISGYCTLYAYMVKLFLEGITDKDMGLESYGHEIHDFFSLSNVWRMIATTIKLTPIVHITATIMYSILTTLDSVFRQHYRCKYAKLISLIRDEFLSKIREISPVGEHAACDRLAAFIKCAV